MTIQERMVMAVIQLAHARNQTLEACIADLAQQAEQVSPDYAELVDIELELDHDEVMMLSWAAHKRCMTLNAFINDAIKQQLNITACANPQDISPADNASDL